MPGMGRSLQTGNSLIVSAFHSALLHQLLVALLVVALCAIGFNVVRTAQYRRLRAQGHTAFPSCLLYTSPSPRDRQKSRMPASA